VNTILPCAQALLYTLMGLMPSPYQNKSLKAVLAMFWEPQRVALPEHCVLKSAAALSRFMNESGFSSVEFVNGVEKLSDFQAIVGIPKNRLMANGKAIKTITKKGQQVQITEFERMVTASWFYLERNGKLEKRFVISTRALKGSTISWWGRRRWAIEGFFKTAKYQFGLARFGQQTLLGVYRWLILSFISFVLTHWVYISLRRANLPDWKEAALLTLQQLLPKTAVNLLLIEVESKRDLLASQGLALELVSIQI
jgi:hypothetical protein